MSLNADLLIVFGMGFITAYITLSIWGWFAARKTLHRVNRSNPYDKRG
jgi:hypothetical protein